MKLLGGTSKRNQNVRCSERHKRLLFRRNHTKAISNDKRNRVLHQRERISNEDDIQVIQGEEITKMASAQTESQYIQFQIYYWELTYVNMS